MRSSGAAPPSGLVTLVFTDIEGSTRLVQSLGERWTKLLQEHRDIMRDAWRTWNGFEMGTEGDSFFVSFPSAQDAVAAAVQAQRALDAHEWPAGADIRVRIGMHTGRPTVVAGDYVGVDVHRAARIASAGHGGQVLLSKDTLDALGGGFPAGVAPRDLGEHRLKDLEQPEWVWQLDIEELPSDFSPIKSLETPSNLPVPSSGFIGRETETRTIAELLEQDVRLVTLTGPGGTGKTRLAIHVARGLLERFLNGVFFVSIAPSSTGAEVPSEIARALQVREIGLHDVVDELAAHLRDKSTLLLLDNFEHVLDAAPAIATLLTRAPRLKIIVTSRAPLRISGEHEVPVAPLAVPEAGTLEEIEASPAVALFLARARAVRGEFALGPDNAGVIADICRRLDGLPLAIELAASKVKVLSPQQISDRLSSRLTLLKGGARDLPARQQTLRDTIGWSYELLDEKAARAFRALGVFPGGATFASIEAVAGDVIDALETLVDHSLVRREGEERYGMLDTIREFALDRLEATGEADATQRALAVEMLRIAEEADPALKGPDQARAGEVFQAEHDNIRSALRWALTEGADPMLGARLATRLGWFWYTHAYAVEGSAWLEAAHGLDRDLPAELRAILLWRLGVLLDTRAEAERAAPLFEEAASLYRLLGDDSGTAAALNSLGSAVRNNGDAARARLLFEESLAIRRKLGDEPGQATALYNLGCLELDEGDPAVGKAMLEEGLALDTKSGDEWGVAGDLNALGSAALDAGDLAEAGALFARALKAFQELGDTDRLAEVLGSLSGLAAAEGRAVRGARLAGAAESVWGRLEIPLAPHDRARFERYQEKARETLGEEAFEQARGEGRSMTIDQAVTFALAENG